MRLPRRASWPLALLAALVLGYVLASWDWCPPLATPAQVVKAERAEGPLSVGAAKAPLEVPLPVVRGGYGPGRPEAREVRSAPYARALVLEAGGKKFALVVLDLLLVPPSLSEAISREAGALGVGLTWVTATHVHSSVGAFDPRLVAEVAGTGRYRDEVAEQILSAARTALREADRVRGPATLELGSTAFPGVVSRNPLPEVDQRLTRLRFVRGDSVVAEWDIAAAHATLVPRELPVIDADFPAALVDRRERQGVGVALFTQGAVGNAAAEPSDEEPWARIAHFAERLSAAIASTEVVASLELRLGWSEVAFSLPHVDASRLVPAPLRRPGDTLVCASSEPRATVSMLELGPLTLLAVPGEPTAGAATRLEQASGATRTVSLVNGYLGYVELPEHVRDVTGEAKRQYYAPDLLDRLAEAAKLAGKSLR